METVAVILCTYNGEVYLKSQIDSILNQDSILVEIFARDDGSTDRTLEILRQVFLVTPCLSATAG